MMMMGVMMGAARVATMTHDGIALVHNCNVHCLTMDGFRFEIG